MHDLESAERRQRELSWNASWKVSDNLNTKILANVSKNGRTKNVETLNYTPRGANNNELLHEILFSLAPRLGGQASSVEDQAPWPPTGAGTGYIQVTAIGIGK